MRNVFLAALLIIGLCGCNREIAGAAADDDATAAAPPVMSAERATEPTYRRWAVDAAVLRNDAAPERSVLIVSAGEAGLEVNDLAGKRLARFEDLEAGFVEAPRSEHLAAALKGIVIATDQRLGAVRAYRFDREANTLHEITAAPLEVNDGVTGLCTYVSPLTDKLYVYVATEQGQLEQWELYERDGAIAGRFIRRIPAGKGVSHCAADDAGGRIYFSEESVGVWSIAAEPEADAARTAVDLIEPRGGLHEEVKGLAVYRPDAGSGFLIARDVGAEAFNIYSLGDGETKQFSIGGPIELGDAEGLTAMNEPLGPAFPQGLLVIADEDAGDYKLVSLGALASTVGLNRAAAADAAPKTARHTVTPVAETDPVASYGDAADDPAIWVDPQNPARSVIIGTDKKLGLTVYDLDGKALQTLPDGRMNNVDLRTGFRLGGRPITIVAATNRTTKSISLYRYDPASQRLHSVADGVLDAGLEDPYGLCMYRSAKSGEHYVFANDSVDGKLRQWKLIERNGKVALEQVREIAVGSQAEGCVADDELGSLYVAEEDVGLWKYSAEPTGGTARTSLDDVEKGNLTADVEGVSIWYGADGKGFLVVSNQGEDNYALYRREGANEFVGKFHVVANSARGVDGASETDGLDVVGAPLGARFPAGLLVVQDGRNLMPTARQNFKLVSWKDVADTLKLPTE